MESKKIEEVKRFWEQNPLFVGESDLIPGSAEFFEHHTSVVVEDCFAGLVDERIFPTQVENKNFPILDAGCGIGFWLEQLAGRGFNDVTGLDISSTALELARSRTDLLNSRFELVEGNLEQLPFSDGSFAHVNCQGVVHHTPNPQAAIAEIARVLRPGGTASISVYCRNWFIRNYDRIKPLVRVLARTGIGLKGRGRESMLLSASSAELVRQYDGAENPIGLSYDLEEFKALLSEFFEVKETFFHFFPRRAVRWVPRAVHRQLDKRLGFMIYATLMKKRPAQEMRA